MRPSTITQVPLARSLRWWLTALLAGPCLVMGLACDGGLPRPTSGSETHFLMMCEESCPGDLACLCGVCTAPCAEDSACADVSTSATCITGTDQACLQPFCDVPCGINEDCSALGTAYRCENGYCRASAGEATGTGTLNECGGESVAGDDVMLIGDSYIEVTGLVGFIEDHAHASGVLGAGERYRNLASSLTPFLSGSRTISSQYEDGRAERPAKVVIMTGGAADLFCADGLMSDCLQAATAAAQALLLRMAEDGVRDVVYFFYPDPVDNQIMKSRFDMLRPLIEDACRASSVPCHFLDLRPTFAGNYERYVGTGGLIFTEPGSQAAAESIWQLMQGQCIAQ